MDFCNVSIPTLSPRPRAKARRGSRKDYINIG